MCQCKTKVCGHKRNFHISPNKNEFTDKNSLSVSLYNWVLNVTRVDNMAKVTNTVAEMFRSRRGYQIHKYTYVFVTEKYIWSTSDA